MKVWQLQEPFCNVCLTAFTSLQIQAIYSVDTNERSCFYELWQQRKWQKTIDINGVFVHQFRPGHLEQILLFSSSSFKLLAILYFFVNAISCHSNKSNFIISLPRGKNSYYTVFAISKKNTAKRAS